MFELRHIGEGVDFLVERDARYEDPLLRAIVCDGPGSVQEATELAVGLQVPLMAAPAMRRSHTPRS